MAKGKGIQAELARKLGISQKDAALKLKVFVEEIGAQLQNGKQIAFLGIGVLETRKRDARSVVNPATKERVSLPERTAPAFRVSETFKEKLKQ